MFASCPRVLPLSAALLRIAPCDDEAGCMLRTARRWVRMRKTHSYPSAERCTLRADGSRTFPSSRPRCGSLKRAKEGQISIFHQPKIKIGPRWNGARPPISDTRWPLPARPWAPRAASNLSFPGGAPFLVLLPSPAGSSQRTLAAMTGRDSHRQSVLLHQTAHGATHSPPAGPRVPSSTPIHLQPASPPRSKQVVVSSSPRTCTVSPVSVSTDFNPSPSSGPRHSLTLLFIVQFLIKHSVAAAAAIVAAAR